MKTKISKCYLCGQVLNQRVNDDHVPPKQFYPQNIRKKYNPNLLTLPTHQSCNKVYQKDEDYFVHSLGPLAQGSYSGNEIWRDLSNQIKRPQGKIIYKMILKEFDPNPSGLTLPGKKAIKRFKPERIWGIVWKIIRGLFFYETGKFLPEATPKVFKIVSQAEEPSPEFAYVRDTSSKGRYRGIFDYKFATFAVNNNMLHLWALLLWDKIILQIAFHDPQCSCVKCRTVENL
jgi:hypothetical protein